MLGYEVTTKTKGREGEREKRERERVTFPSSAVLLRKIIQKKNDVQNPHRFQPLGHFGLLNLANAQLNQMFYFIKAENSREMQAASVDETDDSFKLIEKNLEELSEIVWSCGN